METTFTLDSFTGSPMDSPICNPVSPSSMSSVEDMPPHLQPYAGSPTSYIPPPDFDVNFPPDHFITDVFALDAHEDYQFGPVPASEATQLDMTASGQDVYWSPSPDSNTLHTASSVHSSYLSDLYGDTIPVSIDAALASHEPSGSPSPNWVSDGGHRFHSSQLQQHPASFYSSAHQDHHLIRRASFPSYIPHDREAVLPPCSTFVFDNNETTDSNSFYPHPPEPSSAFHYHNARREPEQTFIHVAPQDFEALGRLKNHGSSPKLNGDNGTSTSAAPTSPASSEGSLPSVTMPNGAEITHTSDAASKETQYLRRRCFNCCTTEPPSWRRSTLNPGKIVCNKCGLYERTHLRPRPHRFDELRGGPKRKSSKTHLSGSLPTGKAFFKGNEKTLSRQESMGSIRSMTSDWDDASTYSASSATSFPSSSTFSPQQTPTIVLPQPPSTSISRGRGGNVKKSVTSPTPWPSSSFRNQHRPGAMPPSLDQFGRRSSFDVGTYRKQLAVETGWQTVPLEDIRPRLRTAGLRNTVVAQ